MTFAYLPVRAARQQAGLDPLPDFICGHGKPSPGDECHDFIDTRYFSPEARHFMTLALAYQSRGGRLEADDLKCANRIWQAVVVFGRKPPSAQLQRFERRQQFNALQRLMPIALEYEMRRRGHYYGPDSDLPEDVELPSEREAMYRYVARELNAPSVGAVKALHNRRLAEFGTR